MHHAQKKTCGKRAQPAGPKKNDTHQEFKKRRSLWHLWHRWHLWQSADQWGWHAWFWDRISTNSMYWSIQPRRLQLIHSILCTGLQKLTLLALPAWFWDVQTLTHTGRSLRLGWGTNTAINRCEMSTLCTGPINVPTPPRLGPFAGSSFKDGGSNQHLPLLLAFVRNQSPLWTVNGGERILLSGLAAMEWWTAAGGYDIIVGVSEANLRLTEALRRLIN